jgi:sulfur carrier protein
MQLRINGKSHQVGDQTKSMSLQHLLEKLGYEPQSIAVAVDGRFVPRHQYASCVVQADQDLEVVAPMQGG